MNRAHPRLMGSLCVKFHDRCKRKDVMHWINVTSPNCFGYQCIETLTFDFEKSIWHIVDSWAVGMKFHDDMCKCKVVMQLNHFT